MKKTFLAVALLALGAGAWNAWAEKPEGKEAVLSGMLVDTNCYLKYGYGEDDHDSVRACGRDCLKGGVPAGLVVDGKLYVIVFPSHVFADFVGDTVELSGYLFEGSDFLPRKAFVVQKDGKKKEITLRGKVMM